MAYIDGKEILFSARVTGGGGAEIVNTLEGNDEDKAPSVAAVNEGLDGKLDIVTEAKSFEQVYVVDTSGRQKMIYAYSGNKNGNIAKFTSKTSSVGDKNYDSGVLITDVPTKPYHCANKKYVDDNIATITSQLGSYIKTVTHYGGREYGGFPVPDNAYPTVYLSDPTFAAINADGESVYTGRATKLIFKNGNEVLGTEDIEDYTNPSCFVTLPEGTKTIALNIDELTEGIWDGTTLHYWGYALFQVKGGA